ncbi:MAG: DUF4406 domain-containing protein [Prevotella sp.]|nr:DUF4406 domain-containing protein [Prevotella sp.]
MRVYISGKIDVAVISEATRRKFARAEEMLKAKFGDEVTVINPTSEYFQENMRVHFQVLGVPVNYQEVLLFDLHWIGTCGAVYFLEDFENSPGATSEYYFALASKKRFFFAAKRNASLYLWGELSKNNEEFRNMSLSKGYDYGKKYELQHLDEVWLPL